MGNAAESIAPSGVIVLGEIRHDACLCGMRSRSMAMKSALGIGRARKKPWPRSQPMR